MEIVSLTKINQSTAVSTPQYSRFVLAKDTVSFQARPKAVKTIQKTAKSQDQFDIFKIVQKMLKNPKTAEVFSKVLLGAAVITEYLTTGKETETKKALISELNKTGINIDASIQGEDINKEEDKVLKKAKREEAKKQVDEKDGVKGVKGVNKETEVKDTDTEVSVSEEQKKATRGRKPIKTSNIEELVKDIQKYADEGLTQTQIADKVGLSRAYLAAIMKKYDIKTNRAKTYGQSKKLLFEEYKAKNPKKYMDYLTKFPKLNLKYAEIVSECLQNPKDKNNTEILKLLEQVFETLYAENPEVQQLREKYFEKLNEDYADDLDKVCLGFQCHVKEGGGAFGYFTSFLKDNVSVEDLENYIKAGKLTFQEFLSVHSDADNFALKTIQHVKNRGNIERLMFDENTVDGRFKFFRVQFKEGTELKDKLQDIVHVNEAIYGPLTLYSDTVIRPIKRLKRELLRLAAEDKELSFTHNIVRFIEPEKVEEYKNKHNLYNKINSLRKDDEEFDEFRSFLISTLENTDLDNENFKCLYNVLKNSELFGDTLQNNHARLRFVGRFVLSRNCSPDQLEGKTDKCVKILNNQLNFRLESGSAVFPYLNSNKSMGVAPSLFLGKTGLGNYTKITLNKDGQIQTIFRDYPDRIRNQDQDQESELLQQ